MPISPGLKDRGFSCFETWQSDKRHLAACNIFWRQQKGPTKLTGGRTASLAARCSKNVLGQSSCPIPSIDSVCTGPAGFLGRAYIDGQAFFAYTERQTRQKRGGGAAASLLPLAPYGAVYCITTM